MGVIRIEKGALVTIIRLVPYLELVQPLCNFLQHLRCDPATRNRASEAIYCLPAEGTGWSKPKYSALPIGCTMEVLCNACIRTKIFSEDVNTGLSLSPERLPAEYYRNYG